jgi:hypothetical protein
MAFILLSTEEAQKKIAERRARQLEEAKAVVKTNLASGRYERLPAIYSVLIREWYKSELPKLEHNKPIFSKNGVLVAVGFNHIVVGDYGPYIEIWDGYINADALKVPDDQRWRFQKKYVGVKYHWYDIDGVKVYHQLKPVSYADYQVGEYYVSPDDVTQQRSAT